MQKQPKPELSKLLKEIESDIRKMHEEVRTFNMVLKGFDGFKGIYDRLKDAEIRARECEEKNKYLFVELQKDFDTKFKMLQREIEGQMNLMMEKMMSNSTKITQQLVEFSDFKRNILVFINIFKSKNLWKITGIVIGLIVFGKSYDSIVVLIVDLIKQIKQ